MDDQIVCELAEGVLLNAHNIQILTILRLLGYDSDDTDTDLASHVMHIRAGKGSPPSWVHAQPSSPFSVSE